MRLFLFALSFSLLTPSLSQAESRPLWGYGVRSCSQYLAAFEASESGDSAEYQRYEDWLSGFASGLNLATADDVMRGTGLEAAMRGAQRYCKRNKDKDFFNASMDFVRVLRGLK